MSETGPRTYVQAPEVFARAIAELRHEPVLGVDTEANSFFVYRERTCLVQVSSGSADYVFDPLAVDLGPLMALFADPAVEKVFHAAEFDVVSLKRDYGVLIRHLYDTSIAARAVGRKRVGLAPLVEETVGIKMAKDEQRSDWGRRPLTAQQLAYAFADTRYLLSLAAALKEEVQGKGLEEEVATDCERVSRREPNPRAFDPEAFEKLPAARKMDPVSRQILRELFIARDARGRELDKPVFRIAGDQALVEAALRKPASKAELFAIPGMTPVVVSRHGESFLEAVRLAMGKGPLPARKRSFAQPDPREEERYERLRAWRRAVAEERGVEVDVIAGNATLRAIARANPKEAGALAQVEELDPYRRTKYGEAMLGAVAGA